MKPRILDLFSGAGGAAMGYARAGFEVVGVDVKPQPRYPFEFHHTDALRVLRGEVRYPPPDIDSDGYGLWMQEESLLRLSRFDAIHASPPCQAFSILTRDRRRHMNLIPETRELLQATGLPYVIENVPGAPLNDPVLICGVALGLRVVRHRLFESNIPLMSPGCAHRRGGTIDGTYIMYADGTRSRLPGRVPPPSRETAFRSGVGCEWMTTREAREAIPPAYTELIGHQLLRHVVRGRGVNAA